MKIGNLKVRLNNIFDNWARKWFILFHYDQCTPLMLMNDINLPRDSEDDKKISPKKEKKM